MAPEGTSWQGMSSCLLCTYASAILRSGSAMMGYSIFLPSDSDPSMSFTCKHKQASIGRLPADQGIGAIEQADGAPMGEREKWWNMAWERMLRWLATGSGRQQAVSNSSQQLAAGNKQLATALTATPPQLLGRLLLKSAVASGSIRQHGSMCRSYPAPAQPTSRTDPRAFSSWRLFVKVG